MHLSKLVKVLVKHITFWDVFIATSNFLVFFFVSNPYDNKGSTIIELLFLTALIMLHIFSILLKQEVREELFKKRKKNE